MAKINYYSTDKLYKVNRYKLKKEFIYTFGFLFSAILLLISLPLLFKSLNFSRDSKQINYTENGDVDYKIYLKENDFYGEPYLKKGMKYLSNLINTINVDFKYKLSADEEMNYTYTYDVDAEIQISDRDDSSKVLYSNNEILIGTGAYSGISKEINILEDLDVDYPKYNNIVNNFRREYAVTAISNLIITLSYNINGEFVETGNQFLATDKLMITIPLAEQTISIDTTSVNNENKIDVYVSQIINNKSSFFTSVIILSISIMILIITIINYLKLYVYDAYKSKVNKLLRNYDRLIVGGVQSIDEKKYKNIIFPDNFNDMVDASQSLNVPILFYEVIPNEKCFFIVCKDDTLYKYRISRAYQENSRNIDNEKAENTKITKKKKTAQVKKAK